MNQAVVKPRAYWISVDGRARTHKSRRAASRNLYLRSHNRTLGAEVAVLGLVVAILQILDGVLTGLGMMHFGTGMEGNAFLREIMHLVGCVPALVLVKTIAIGVVTGLCLHAYKVTWLKPALKCVIGLYVGFAVLPWTIILATEYLG